MTSPRTQFDDQDPFFHRIIIRAVGAFHPFFLVWLTRDMPLELPTVPFLLS